MNAFLNAVWRVSSLEKFRDTQLPETAPTVARLAQVVVEVFLVAFEYGANTVVIFRDGDTYEIVDENYDIPLMIDVPKDFDLFADDNWAAFLKEMDDERCFGPGASVYFERHRATVGDDASPYVKARFEWPAPPR